MIHKEDGQRNYRLSKGATLLETTWYLEPVVLTRLANYAASNQDSNVTLRKTGTVNDKLAQAFQIDTDTTVTSVKLWLRKVGSSRTNRFRARDIFVLDLLSFGNTANDMTGSGTNMEDMV